MNLSGDRPQGRGETGVGGPAAVTATGGRRVPVVVWLYVAVAGSVVLRAVLLDFESADYRNFLSAWYDYLVEHGRWHGLATINDEVSSASYAPLYLYFVALATWVPVPKLYAIKAITLVGDYLTAWYVWRLVRRLAARAVAAFLYLPTVWLNGAVWGQCDVLWTGALVASLYYLLEKRSVAALVAFGLAGSLKPQAIFWGPLLAGWVVSGRLSWRRLWIPPAVWVACGVPQMLAGRPVLHVLGHWLRVRNTPGFNFGATNWYQWGFDQAPEVFGPAGEVLTLVGTAAFVLKVWEGPRPGLEEAGWAVRLALVSVLFPPFLLPGMHERYFFGADVLAVVYAFYVPRGWMAAVGVQFASVFTYLPYLFQVEPVPRWALALVMAGVIGWVTAEAFGGRGRPVCAEEEGGGS